MNRGSFSSSSSSSPDDPPRRGRSRQMDSSPLSTFRDSRVTRSSVLPSGVLPYLRRLDLGDSSHPPHKEPLLVLKLSSSSFLDSEVNDDISRIPLYTIRTNRNQTSVIRSVGHTTAGEIEWPVLDPSKGKGKHDGVIIQMRSGRRKPADTFLRPGSILSAPRKFKIPGYSRSLKWKAVGSSYWCLAASAKGPIAILDPAVETLPPRLKIFETLHDKYEGRPMMTHQGVSILLLDYVVVTALLLMTDIQEWMVVQKHDGEVNQRLPPEVSGSDDFGPRSAPPASTSALQWRKVIYGEPLYPKRQSSASTSSHVRFPRNPNQFAKILNGDPIYPTLHSLHRESSSIDFSSSSESESDHETESEDILDARIQPSSTPPRAPSPSAESVLYPLTTASAPSHTYLDPSFYNEYSVPPVPPLPAEYASSHNIASPVSASTFRRFRELPRPPPHHSMIHRSRSSPPRPHTSPSSPVEPSSAVSQPDRRRPSIDSTFLTRNVSQSQRTLPQPPPIPVQEASSSHLPLRHSQSSTRPLNTRTREKHSSQCPRRTLPPTPITVSHPDWMTGLRIRKRSHNELAQWFNDGHEPLPSRYDDHRQSMVFEALDCPPPAYNSLEFAAGTSLTIDSSSSLPPPPPVHDLQGSLQ